MRVVAVAFACALLGACTPGPTGEYELAAQGLYTGAISPDGRFSVVGSMHHGASLWRLTDVERLFNWSHKSGEPAALVSTAFSAQANRAVTTDPRTLVIWDTATGEGLSYWATPGAVLDVAMLPDGSSVLMGLEDHSAVLFNGTNGSHTHTFLHEGRVNSVAVSDDGLWAATGSEDETAALWNLTNGRRVHTFAHGNPVRQVALSANGALALTAAEHAEVAIWESSGGHVRHLLYERNPGVTAARFSADGRLLLLGFLNRDVELWATDTGTRLAVWDARARHPWRPTGAAILAVGFTSEATVLALAGDGRLVSFRRS